MMLRPSTFGEISVGANDEGVDVSLGEYDLTPKESFKYLGSMIHKGGDVEVDVSHRIKRS